MPHYKITKKAQADLLAIGRFTAEKWGVFQRNTYLKQLDNCFSQLAENPNLGIICDFIAKGYRKFPQSSHLVFYRQGLKGLVEIIRVLHKSMDVESNFQIKSIPSTTPKSTACIPKMN